MRSEISASKNNVRLFRFEERALWLLLLSFLPLTLTGCGEEPSEAEALFEESVQPLFEASCREGCHEPGGFNGDLLLGAGFGSSELVSVPSLQADMALIEPGSLEESYLWHKVQWTHLDAGGEGEAMPYAGAKLSEEELASIEEYILLLEK